MVTPGTAAKGRIIAVWGPAGAPGRTLVAANIAGELAAEGQSVLLVDADSYGASVAALLGLLDEAAGLAQACRLADHRHQVRRHLWSAAGRLRMVLGRQPVWSAVAGMKRNGRPDPQRRR